jgi:hypothetical protein
VVKNLRISLNFCFFCKYKILFALGSNISQNLKLGLQKAMLSTQGFHALFMVKTGNLRQISAQDCAI